MQGLFKENENNRTQSFNFKFRNIDDVISLNKFDEKKNTTDTAKSTSCNDLHFDIDNEGPLRTKCYDKRDDFNNYIVFVLMYLYMLQHYNDIHIFLSWSDIPEPVFPMMNTWWSLTTGDEVATDSIAYIG